MAFADYTARRFLFPDVFLPAGLAIALREAAGFGDAFASALFLVILFPPGAPLFGCGSSACAARATVPGWAADGVARRRSGNFCFNFNTGACRSPIFSKRSRTCAASNTSELASFLRRARSTSSQETGVDTVGCSRARSEYTDPEVFGKLSSPQCSKMSRSHRPTCAHCTMLAGAPGSRSNTIMVGQSMSEANASDG